MAQHYSALKRESAPHALPDLETYQADAFLCSNCDHTYPFDEGCPECGSKDREPEGRNMWFYVLAFPGCLPDSDPAGPFDTEAEALADAREGVEADAE